MLLHIHLCLSTPHRGCYGNAAASFPTLPCLPGPPPTSSQASPHINLGAILNQISLRPASQTLQQPGSNRGEQERLAPGNASPSTSRITSTLDRTISQVDSVLGSECLRYMWPLANTTSLPNSAAGPDGPSPSAPLVKTSPGLLHVHGERGHTGTREVVGSAASELTTHRESVQHRVQQEQGRLLAASPVELLSSAGNNSLVYKGTWWVHELASDLPGMILWFLFRNGWR